MTAVTDIDRDPSDLGLSPAPRPERLFPPLPGEHVCHDGWIVPLDDPDNAPVPCRVCKPHLQYTSRDDRPAWRPTGARTKRRR